MVEIFVMVVGDEEVQRFNLHFNLGSTRICTKDLSRFELWMCGGVWVSVALIESKHGKIQ